MRVCHAVLCAATRLSGFGIIVEFAIVESTKSTIETTLGNQSTTIHQRRRCLIYRPSILFELLTPCRC